MMKKLITLLSLLTFTTPPLTLAGAPPEKPILLIESGMHSAMIKRIATDAKNRYLVTASEDKTARIWELASGTLIRTLRPPIGPGNEGKLYAVAISPDGSTVAASGWTGYYWDGKFSIYLFNTTTGEIRERITGLPNVINNLTFSKDNRYLAASLGGNNGIRLYRTTDYREYARDTDYGSSSYDADFDREGNLVTTSDDGYIRLYNSNFHLIHKKRAPGGKEPAQISFSPDGREIAVGFNDAPVVNILSVKDLSLLYTPDTTGINNGNLFSVAWSARGAALYAGGRWCKGGKNPIRKWNVSGRGSYTDLTGPGKMIMHILPLRTGGIVYGAIDPAFGVFDREGASTLARKGGNAQYTALLKNLLISHDGATVRFGYKPWGKSPALFSIKEERLSLNPENTNDLLAPRTTAKGLSVTDWKNSYTPKLNNTPLKLEKYEFSRSLAISKAGVAFLLGTEWYLRLFDRAGRERWSIPVPGIAWAVNISGDNTKAVAAFGDGTIRWYSMKTGNELLAFFPHSDQKRWVLWTPAGYYTALAGAEDLIGWHKNNGSGQAADFFPASKFREVYNRPDVIRQILKTLDPKEALAQADREST